MKRLLHLMSALVTSLLTICLGRAYGKNSTTKAFQKIDEILNMYDRRLYPTFDSGDREVTVVNCSMHILSFSSINAESMDYTVDIYLRQEWRDERLIIREIERELYFNNQDFLDSIWKPDLFFTNMKRGHFQDITVPNFYLRLYPQTGDLTYSSRLSLTLSCQMKLYTYPMDEQICNMDFESYTYTTKQMMFNWKEEKPIQIVQPLELPQFELVNFTTINCTTDLSTGTFPCLRATFHLRRQFGYHLIQSYLPTVLIVFMSWVSFWLDVDAIPARVTLGVTTLLTITTLAGGVRVSLPPVSYIKAIDVWMGTCTIFVFGALLEFTLTNYLSRKRPLPPRPRVGYSGNNGKMFDNDRAAATQMIFGEGVNHRNSLTMTDEQAQAAMEIKYKAKAKRLDDKCRIMFPLSFFLFNLVYWPAYLFFYKQF